MAAATGTQMVETADRRTLTIAECGDPGGFPVFSLHGTPGSRLAGQGAASAYTEVGARVITYDRPGYGGSDRCRGRQVVDCVADISTIADSLGIERFAVTGSSWGGPHSLAVAARLPERVSRAACIACVAPFDAPGLDWFADMDAVNIEEIGWALEGEEVLAPNIERVAGRMLERVAKDPSKMISDEVELSEADRAYLANPKHQESTRRMINEAFRQGVSGYVDDALCVSQPWGFDVTEIRAPTRIYYGLADVLVPRQHGEWLAENVPNAEVVVDEKAGHSPDPNLVAERIGWLLQPV